MKRKVPTDFRILFEKLEQCSDEQKAQDPSDQNDAIQPQELDEIRLLREIALETALPRNTYFSRT